MEDGSSWRPPTDAELKVLEARRERMDKISMIMGDYLLKGYKMLGDICDVCSTILLEDRQNNKYCIACSEVDTSENLKDNPVLSDVAAQRQVEELQTNNSELHLRECPATDLAPTSPDRGRYAPSEEQSREVDHICMGPPLSLSDNLASADRLACLDVSTALEVVEDKLSWATRELRACPSVDLSIQMCQLVKSCAEALLALRNLRLGSEPSNAATPNPHNLKPL